MDLNQWRKHRINTLTEALITVRVFIKGEPIENVIMDLGDPNYTLGQYLDDILKRNTPPDAASSAEEGK